MATVSSQTPLRPPFFSHPKPPLPRSSTPPKPPTPALLSPQTSYPLPALLVLDMYLNPFGPFIYGTPSMEFSGLIKIAMHGAHPCDLDRRDWESGSGVLVDSVVPWIKQVLQGCVEVGRPVMMQACMYLMTPDGDFIIDFLGEEFGKDVVVVEGFSSHDFKMGPVVGRILAEMVINGEVVGFELKHFRLGRFEEDPKGNAKEFEDQVSSHVNP